MYSYYEKEVSIDIAERLLNAMKLIGETQKLRAIGINCGAINVNTYLIIAHKYYVINVLKKWLIDYPLEVNIKHRVVHGYTNHTF